MTESEALDESLHLLVDLHLLLLPGLHREGEAGNVVAPIVQALIAGVSPVVSSRNPLHVTSVRAAPRAVFAQVQSRLRPVRIDRCTPPEYRGLARKCVAFNDALGVWSPIAA